MCDLDPSSQPRVPAGDSAPSQAHPAAPSDARGDASFAPLPRAGGVGGGSRGTGKMPPPPQTPPQPLDPAEDGRVPARAGGVAAGDAGGAVAAIWCHFSVT